MRRIAEISLLALSASCATHSADAPPPEPPAPTNVALGVPGGPDGLDFAALADGDEVRLKTFGQGGTHLVLGVRTIGFGTRAYVGFAVTDTSTGLSISAPPPVRPQLFACDDALTCDLVPVTLMTGGLIAPDDTRDVIPVVLTTDVHDDAGDTGTAELNLNLSTADLH